MRGSRILSIALLIACLPACDNSADDEKMGALPPLPNDRPSYSIEAVSPADEQVEIFVGRYPARPDFEFAVLNEAGEVASTTRQHNGAPPDYGYAAWLYREDTLQYVGLTDSDHTDVNGKHQSTVAGMNEAGQVAGTSTQSNGGTTAWLHAAGSSIPLGLTDAEHTLIDGAGSSTGKFLNQPGQVAGWSTRSEDLGGGATAWLYRDGVTVSAGLTDANHTSSAGQRDSVPVGLNRMGQVVGNSTRYTGAAENGSSAWLYIDGTTTDISYIDADHTGLNGQRASRVTVLNNNGEAIGVASRYDSAGEVAGKSTWSFSAGDTRIVGPGDPLHLSDTGFPDSRIYELNDAGQVIGTSFAFNPAWKHAGQSAWIDSGGITTIIGLLDDEHRDADGYRSSGLTYWMDSLLNQSGHVAGHSERFNVAGESIGNSSWLYINGETRHIGLIDDLHTRQSDGYRFSREFFLNSSGQVAGHAERFGSWSDDTRMPKTAWFYDPDHKQTHSLGLSERSDGYADSEVLVLNDSGVALGTYQLFDGNDQALGYRPFYFSLKYGLHDLSSLIVSGMEAWASLDHVVAASESGYILGVGTLQGSNHPIYFLLTPVAMP